MKRISDRIEQIDHLLQDDPVGGFELAVSLLDSRSASRCDHSRARALDAYGSACRVFGDLARAEDAYAQADELCGCEHCRWDRLRRMSYLRAEQGLPDAALRLAADAVTAAPDRAMTGRCRLAVAYARFVARDDLGAITAARQALGELGRTDLLYLVAAANLIGFCASRLDGAPEELLREARADLRSLRRRWPRHTVGISDLPTHLSAVLTTVKGGEEVILDDHGKPVARLSPILATGPTEAQPDERTHAGVVRRPVREFDEEFWSLPRPADPQGAVLKALLAERGEGR